MNAGAALALVALAVAVALGYVGGSALVSALERSQPCHTDAECARTGGGGGPGG
jgi:hypothetical protein